MLDKLEQAKGLAETEPDEALRLCNEVLNENIDDVHAQQAMFISAYIMLKAQRHGMAYNLYKRCEQLRPNQAEIYVNMGMCLEESRPEEAAKYFQKAQRLDPDNANAYANEGLIALQQANAKRCIYLSNKALDINPDSLSALQNRSLAYLMERDFKRGWRDFYKTIGVDARECRNYGAEEWTPDSEPGSIVVYGEEGIGDELMFASCIPDLQKDGFDIILDVDERLEKLFQHSFPYCVVYGDRFKPTSRVIDNHKPRYQCAIGQLPAKYRKQESDFPGKPYIYPTYRARGWRAIFDQEPGLKIGVAWSGGRSRTGKKKRTLDPDCFDELLATNNTFVCLEYKEVQSDIISRYDLRYFPDVVKRGADFQLLVDMVAELDLVITSCTTIVYVAGALGIPCHVLVPQEPGYRYHSEGDTFPWYESVTLHRDKGDWKKTIKEVMTCLKL